MRRCAHLTQDERYHIQGFLKTGLSCRGIAHKMEGSPSMVSRELKRNRGGRGWRPKQAEVLRQEGANQGQGLHRKTSGVRGFE